MFDDVCEYIFLFLLIALTTFVILSCDIIQIKKLKVKINLVTFLIQHKIHSVLLHVKNYFYYDCYMNYKKNWYINHNQNNNSNITIRKSMKPPSDIFK